LFESCQVAVEDDSALPRLTRRLSDSSDLHLQMFSIRPISHWQASAMFHHWVIGYGVVLIPAQVDRSAKNSAFLHPRSSLQQLGAYSRIIGVVGNEALTEAFLQRRFVD